MNRIMKESSQESVIGTLRNFIRPQCGMCGYISRDCVSGNLVRSETLGRSGGTSTAKVFRYCEWLA